MAVLGLDVTLRPGNQGHQAGEPNLDRVILVVVRNERAIDNRAVWSVLAARSGQLRDGFDQHPGPVALFLQKVGVALRITIIRTGLDEESPLKWQVVCDLDVEPTQPRPVRPNDAFDPPLGLSSYTNQTSPPGLCRRRFVQRIRHNEVLNSPQ